MTKVCDAVTRTQELTQTQVTRLCRIQSSYDIPP
jgi:hypothetical protein